MATIPAFVTASFAMSIFAMIMGTYFLASLVVHFRLSRSESGASDPTAEYLAKWMTRGAFGVVLAGFPFYLLLFIHYGFGGSLSATGCLLTENLPGVFYVIHKFCTYMFIYMRVKTFEDFFSETGWKRLRYFAMVAAGAYFLVFVIIIPYVNVANVEEFDPSYGYCYKKFRRGETFLLVLGALTVLLDVTIASVGTIAFVRVLFCSETLSQITKKDPEIAAAGRNVATWSSVAFLSTMVFLALSLRTDWIVFSMCDVMTNSFCVCKQYPECLSSLIKLVFGNYKRTEAVVMVTDENL